MEQEDAKAPGKQSFSFGSGVYVGGMASVAGKLESEGPLGEYFDIVGQDDMFDGKTWEEAESNMQLKAAEHAIADAGLKADKIRYMAGGDLLGQLIATTFGVEKLAIPLLGLYGACSTMGESLLAGAVLVDGGYADHVLTITSSHFAGAEKQFRFPLAYGNQRPMAATWTVTGSGAVILSRQPGKYNVRLLGATMGRVIDYGVKDSMNMGACMAPAAASTIVQNLEDFGREPKDYDKIITGDLGEVGQKLLFDLLAEKQIDITRQHMDCGIEIYDNEKQHTDAGGSGCGCSAVVLSAYVLKKIEEGIWKRVLFLPTGALLSKTSYNEGQSIPGIAHGVVLEWYKG